MFFTWGLACRLGLSVLGAAVAAFTFGTCGFVASKVIVGNLPMLEAIPALPLLLWLVDRVVRDDGTSRTHVADWHRLLALALASALVALAGHPQVVIYAFAVAGAYAWTVGTRARALVATAASALGTGCAGVVLLPMAMLVGRSTRVLALDRASNDWALPYWRLPAFFAPWRDGFPIELQHRPWRPWTQPNVSLFWDSVVYLGLLPWLGVLGLALLLIVRRRKPGRQATFWVVVGLAALAMALPFWQGLTGHLRGTLLRSPARLMYVVSFALSLAAGAALDRLTPALRARIGRAGALVVAVLVLAHLADVGSHARAYVLTRARSSAVADGNETAWLAGLVGDGRVAIDYDLDSPHNRRFDDIGIFDSILLERPYRFVLDSSFLSPGLNQQTLSARQMRPRTLAAAGVKLVATMDAIPALPLLRSFPDGFLLYRVEGAAARARFYDTGEVDFIDATGIHARLRDPSTDLDLRLMLEPSGRSLTTSTPVAAAAPGPPAEARVAYGRPSSDLIAVTVETAQPGYVRVLENWDPGWQAAVDGQSVPALPGNDVFLTAAVPAGRHLVTFAFTTPGVETGIALSLGSACLLALLLLGAARGWSPGKRS